MSLCHMITRRFFLILIVFIFTAEQENYRDGVLQNITNGQQEFPEQSPTAFRQYRDPTFQNSGARYCIFFFQDDSGLKFSLNGSQKLFTNYSFEKSQNFKKILKNKKLKK